MPAVFCYSTIVRPDDIDPYGHVNNIVYLRWMQDAAVAHSAEQGWNTERYQQINGGWVARSHFIEYRLPCFVEEPVIVRTWVADMKRMTSLRKYEIIRPVSAQSEELLARAETNWAFVDLSTRKLARIPQAVATAFELHSATASGAAPPGEPSGLS